MGIVIWTEERDAALVRLWPNTTRENIARQIGVTLGAVKSRAMMRRLGPPFREPAQERHGWPKLDVGDWPKIDGPGWEDMADPNADRGAPRYVPEYRLRPAPSAASASVDFGGATGRQRPAMGGAG